MQSQDRVEKLLALLLIQGMKAATQREKALQLSVAGFTNTEIADLLQTTALVVGQSLYEARRERRKRPKTQRKSKYRD
jgi:DNA-directed RNA polymerase specialized sigma24 family protein